jgi:hypothetical protein
MDPNAHVSMQMMPLALYVDVVALTEVTLIQPISPAQDEFSAKMVVVLSGAGMQPPPLMYWAGAKVWMRTLLSDADADAG